MVTVEGPGMVNINTAPKDVLEALGVPASLVGKILICRKGADGIEGTADDIVFSNKTAVPEQLEKRWPLTESDRAAWLAIEDQISVKGSALRLDVPVTLDDSPSKRRVQIVLNSETSACPVRYWREGETMKRRSPI